MFVEENESCIDKILNINVPIRTIELTTIISLQSFIDFNIIFSGLFKRYLPLT